ncbi:hypothetical protein K2X33_08070, partial [bacterium]|nr:hypothetical protein [bacterium]
MTASQKPAQPPDFLLLFSLACLSSFAFCFFLLAPLPVLYAQMRFSDPLPKAMALAGAVIAIVSLPFPMPWIAVSFTLAVVTADQVYRRGRLLPALVTGVGAATAVEMKEKKA